MLLSKSVSKHLPPSSSSSSSRFHFLIQHSSCVLSPGLFWCIHTKRETTRKLGRHRKIMTLLRSEVLRNNRGVKIFNTADYNRFVCDPEWTLHELTYVSQATYHTDICKKSEGSQYHVTLHVYYLVFIMGPASSCQSSGHSARLHLLLLDIFDKYNSISTWYQRILLRRPRDNFQPSLWQKNWIFLTGCRKICICVCAA